MAEKRRDKRNRILHDNEFQRKDGRYEYRYTDSKGEQHSVYSWRLVATDKLPSGKRTCEALRDLEKQIEEQPEEETVNPVTINECWDAYLSSRVDLRENTIRTYTIAYDKYVRPVFGQQQIADVTPLMIRRYYQQLLTKDGLKMSRVKAISILINSTFSMAQREEIIQSNPATGMLNKIYDPGPRPQHRRALTKNEQEEFLHFIEQDPKSAVYKPLYICLLGTGCRISEMLGLTWDNVDWEQNCLHITQSINELTGEHRLSLPKTEAGIRDIPMLTVVKETLLNIKEIQEQQRYKPFTVAGRTGFVWQTPQGTLPTRNTVCVNLYRAIDRHNANCEPSKVLPRFSLHQLRHTFCTRICENETDLKLIQEIMGHSNIQTTMNIYNESNLERKQESFRKMQENAVIFAN